MKGDGTFKKLHILQSRVVHSTTNLTLFRFITLFCETVSILQNIPMFSMNVENIPYKILSVPQNNVMVLNSWFHFLGEVSFFRKEQSFKTYLPLTNGSILC